MAEVLQLENVRIGFKNFAGVEGKYNKAGDRNFVVFLSDPAEARQMLADGWNVKHPKEREAIMDEDDTREPYLPVALGFGAYPPKVVMIAGEEVTKLEEQDIDMLDWAEIERVDLIVRPYTWSVNGNTGVKAYVKAMYVTIATDDFAARYGV